MTKLNTHEIVRMQIKRIEKEIRDTPYHKATEHHIGRLRAKLSKLKGELDKPSGKKGGGGGYAVKKQGNATIVLVGPPSVGKSTLLNKLTNAKSKIAPYAFTTVSVIPGMMEYKNAYIQILDVPGLIEGAEEGKGRGREVLSVVRGADLLIVMTDVKRVEALARITKVLYKNGIRINSNPPQVTIEKKLKGGLLIHSNIKQDLAKETIKAVATELGVKNAEINIKEKLDMDSLIDALTPSRVYIPTLFLINKIDEGGKVKGIKALLISAEEGKGLENLKEKIWESLCLVRVFLVRKDEKPSFENPIIVKKGDSLLAVAKKIGAEFSENKKRAKIWGTGSKFAGQDVSLSTKVQEGMQTRFI